MPPSMLDSIYRRMLITKFFEKGWGKPENLQRLFEFRKIISKRESCFKLVPYEYPVEIISEQNYPDCKLLEGKFMTPLELHLPGVVPKAAQQAHFQVLIPKEWNHEKHKPMCIHLAGTGDHFYWRRRNFIAKPLLKEANIGAIILENPFYGVRKPDDQVRSNLHNVSDIFVMGGCLILECLVLLNWCEKNNLGPLGVTGLSMGGHMASLAATNWPKPLVLVPCLSWSTASTVFTTGVMSQSINWDMLETQYHSDGKYSERLSKMVTVIDDAFSAGQKFIKNFNRSLKELKQDIRDARNLNEYQSKDFDGLPTAGSGAGVDGSIFYQNPKFINDRLNGGKDTTSTSTSSSNTTSSSNIDAKRNFRTDNKNFDAKNLAKIQNNGPMTTLKTETTVLAKSLPMAVKEESNSALTKLMKYILPQTAETKFEKIDITKTNWWEREALQFMRGMMDECTHLKNFSVPYDTSLIIAICAKDDAYVPREGCTSLEDIWPGAEIRYLDAGHVSAYVLHQKLFRSCIVEAFERAKKIYDNDNAEVLGEPFKCTITYDELWNRYQSLLGAQY